MLFPTCLPGEHPLDTATTQQNDNDIMEDSLSCPACGRTYPVENGVAYILPNDQTTVTSGSNAHEQPGVSVHPTA
ncbi:MAG TPA: Trm112 family protein [Desulfobacteraceae bacterium]|nr:Trm112 family protein [Desulfobacteraceae bacterium]